MAGDVSGAPEEDVTRARIRNFLANAEDPQLAEELQTGLSLPAQEVRAVSAGERSRANAGACRAEENAHTQHLAQQVTGNLQLWWYPKFKASQDAMLSCRFLGRSRRCSTMALFSCANPLKAAPKLCDSVSAPMLRLLRRTSARDMIKLNVLRNTARPQAPPRGPLTACQRTWSQLDLHSQRSASASTDASHRS